MRFDQTGTEARCIWTGLFAAIPPFHIVQLVRGLVDYDMARDEKIAAFWAFFV